MGRDTYKLSFTFGGLLVPETLEVAECYLKYQKWELVRKEADENRILKKNEAEQ